MRSAFVDGAAALPRPTTSATILPPRRVQRSRRKGAPLPEGAVNCCRPTRWCNPFAGRKWGHVKSVILHRRWLKGQFGALTLERLGFSGSEIATLDRRRCWILTHLHELAGKDLACFCSLNSKWCHVDVYVELAPIHADYDRRAA